MKRIALLVCVLVLLVANTAEARWLRRGNRNTYIRPAVAAPATYQARPTDSQTTELVSDEETEAEAVEEADSTSSTEATPAASAEVKTTVQNISYSTATAQGVANLMARSGTVGHWGGNRSPEGCGCGATPAAAYNICCFANSGMATVDVGYARGANGMWYCCRRYR